MSDVIPFRPTMTSITRIRTPTQALEYALEKVSASEEQGTLIVAWQKPGELQDHTEFRYVIGGNADLSASIGLLEITKTTLMSET